MASRVDQFSHDLGSSFKIPQGIRRPFLLLSKLQSQRFSFALYLYLMYLTVQCLSFEVALSI